MSYSGEAKNFRVVITSINKPTEAVIQFCKQSSRPVIVVGDAKSPSTYYADNAEFLSLKSQASFDFSIRRSLPENHYSRKMIGYLSAMQSGCDYIVDTDDDNIPVGRFTIPEFRAPFRESKPNLGFINIYGEFTSEFVWPRGLPLDALASARESLGSKLDTTFRDLEVGIFQGLADDDPDVDLIIGEDHFLINSSETVRKLTRSSPWFKKLHPPTLRCSFMAKAEPVKN